MRRNITFQEYDAGHMMYIDTPSRLKLKSDIAAWIDSALSGSSSSLPSATASRGVDSKG
jgi:carboxypeptidase C (cathepsin A)